MAEDPHVVFNFPDPVELAPPIISCDQASVGYNGRAVLEQVAAQHGWAAVSVTPCFEDQVQTVYGRDGIEILIVWTPLNTATAVVKNYGKPDETVANGPLGLVTARGWMEENR